MLPEALFEFGKLKKIATDKYPFYDHIWSLLLNYTEIQMVILRCSRSLNLNWYKSYDAKRKNARNANECF